MEQEVCNDCNRPIEWDEERKDYRHLVDPERGCFLIRAEAADLVETLAQGVAAGIVPSPSRMAAYQELGPTLAQYVDHRDAGRYPVTAEYEDLLPGILRYEQEARNV